MSTRLNEWCAVLNLLIGALSAAAAVVAAAAALAGASAEPITTIANHFDGPITVMVARALPRCADDAAIAHESQARLCRHRAAFSRLLQDELSLSGD